jgi:hypothetical protein
MSSTTEEQQQHAQTSPPPSDEAVEKMVKARQEGRRRAAEEGEDPTERSPNQVMRAAAKGDRVTPEEVQDALEVFFAEEGDEPEIEPTPLKLNIGTRDKPKWIAWEIVPVDDEEITRLRKESRKGNRRAKRAGEAEVDDNLVARRIVVKGTVSPDLRELASRLKLVDPADALLKYFRRFGKTGLILQISGEILSISGYDDEDISELDAARG